MEDRISAFKNSLALVRAAKRYAFSNLIEKPRQARHARLLRRAVSAVEAFPSVKSKRKHGLAGGLIVSLTSHPPRFATLAPTLRSLLDQTAQADSVILWLSHGDAEKLPNDVISLKAHGLQVRETSDLRSFTKLVPSLVEYPDSYIVTVDDDLYYAPEFLSRLVDGVKPGEKTILGLRAHFAKFDPDGNARPYNSWEFETAKLIDVEGKGAIFLTGVGGVLYPPGCFSSKVTDQETFMALCPRADDVWFFAMSILAGTPRRRLTGKFDVVNWPSSQDCGLMHENVHNSANDAQIARVFSHFPELKNHFKSPR